MLNILELLEYFLKDVIPTEKFKKETKNQCMTLTKTGILFKLLKNMF